MIFVGTFCGVTGVILGVYSVPTASSALWCFCLNIFRFGVNFVLGQGCPTCGVFWFGHDFFLRLVVFDFLLWYMPQNSRNPRGWLLFPCALFPCSLAQIVWCCQLIMDWPYYLEYVRLVCLQVLLFYVSLDVCVITRRQWFFVLVCYKKKFRDHMYLIPLDLCKCALMVVITLDFRKCALLVVNVLLWRKPDDSGRNPMTQARYSCRNVMITQARGEPHKLDILVEGSFQLQMGFSFPFLRANDLRSSLLIMRTRIFYSLVRRGYIRKVSVQLVWYARWGALLMICIF